MHRCKKIKKKATWDVRSERFGSKLPSPTPHFKPSAPSTPLKALTPSSHPSLRVKLRYIHRKPRARRRGGSVNDNCCRGCCQRLQVSTRFIIREKRIDRRLGVSRKRKNVGKWGGVWKSWTSKQKKKVFGNNLWKIEKNNIWKRKVENEKKKKGKLKGGKGEEFGTNMATGEKGLGNNPWKVERHWEMKFRKGKKEVHTLLWRRNKIKRSRS